MWQRMRVCWFALRPAGWHHADRGDGAVQLMSLLDTLFRSLDFTMGVQSGWLQPKHVAAFAKCVTCAPSLPLLRCDA